MSAAEPTAADRPKRPFQFTLRQILLLMVACGLVLALLFHWGMLGLIGGYFVLAVGAIAWGWRERSYDWTSTGVAMLILPACVVLLVPVDSFRPKPPRPQSRCRFQLKQISLSLLVYHDTYGSFPPAIVSHADGTPMHSWRVLLLPFIGEQALYDAYDFAEPWNGPNNRRLHDSFVESYCCPSCSSKQPSTETNYVAVVGPQTMWPGEKAKKLADLKDGADQTLMVVEVHGSGIHWMEPRDLHVVQMPQAINPPRGQGISSPHKGIAHGAFADGYVEAIPETITPERLSALLSIAGGEPRPPR